MDKRIKGQLGEDMAVRFYENLGHEILHRNLRTYFGEIDLLTRYKNQVHVVEVKAYSRSDFGDPIGKWNNSQKRRLAKAINYLIAIGVVDTPENLVCEFISIDISNLNDVRCKRYKNIQL